MWENAIGQRVTLTGTVVQAQDNGSGDQLTKAGTTGSFVSVKRELLNPKTFLVWRQFQKPCLWLQQNHIDLSIPFGTLRAVNGTTWMNQAE